MFKSWLPIYEQAPVMDLRKRSLKLLSNFFSALIYLVGRDASPWGLEFMSALKASISMVDLLYQTNAASFFENMKGSLVWFRHAVHGDYLSMKDMKFSAADWDFTVPIREGCPRILAPLFRVWWQFDPRPTTIKTGDWNPGSRMVVVTRIIFAFLSCYRVVTVAATLDLGSITDDYTGKQTPVTHQEVTTALSALGIEPKEFQSVLSDHVSKVVFPITTSQGPNGQSLFAAHLDSVAIVSNQEFFESFKLWCEEHGLKDIISRLVANAMHPKSNEDTKDPLVLGKIHVIEEMGGKSRHIAIADYWSQLVLTPLHNTINHFLKKLPMDATFDQDAACEVIRNWSVADIGLYSYDLTTATDRLPRSLGVEILNHLGKGSSYGTLWERMMTGRDFKAPNDEMVRYKVGQPMGLKSSFPMLGLMHHVIVQIAVQRASLSDFVLYRLLGDDITIANEAVAREYLILMENYGVAVNTLKSVISPPGELGAAEFCKRFYVKGVEISALPVKLTARTADDGKLAPALHNELLRRGMFSAGPVLAEFITALVDNTSLQDYLRLNALPTSVTGLSKAVTLPGFSLDPSTWYDGKSVGISDLDQLYVYTVATESLKRLDALVRQTGVLDKVIKQAVGRSFGEPSVMDYSSIQLNVLNELKKIYDETFLTHPAVLAATHETQRVAELLALLQSGKTEIRLESLRELVDTLRNSLPHLATDRAKAQVTSQYSLVERMLRHLDSIVLDRKDNTLTFTSLIMTVQRVWSVSFRLGDRVWINSVKSSVRTFVGEVHALYNHSVTSITMSPRRRDDKFRR